MKLTKTTRINNLFDLERVELIMQLMSHTYSKYVLLYPKASSPSPLPIIVEETPSLKPLSLYEEALLTVAANWQFFKPEEKQKLKQASQGVRDDVKFMVEELNQTNLSQ
jgi:hypothetical protein